MLERIQIIAIEQDLSVDEVMQKGLAVAGLFSNFDVPILGDK
jgi:hypothetical protein